MPFIEPYSKLRHEVRKLLLLVPFSRKESKIERKKISPLQYVIFMYNDINCFQNYDDDQISESNFFL